MINTVLNRVSDYLFLKTVTVPISLKISSMSDNCKLNKFYSSFVISFLIFFKEYLLSL